MRTIQLLLIGRFCHSMLIEYQYMATLLIITTNKSGFSKLFVILLLMGHLDFQLSRFPFSLCVLLQLLVVCVSTLCAYFELLSSLPAFCFQMISSRSQCGQIFIGMVTSNYQAKLDIVSLIEQMDNACIRFVHFSRDQELRSRVSVVEEH